MSGKHLSPTPPDVSGGVEEKMYTRGLAQGGPEWLSLVGTVDADTFKYCSEVSSSGYSSVSSYPSSPSARSKGLY